MCRRVGFLGLVLSGVLTLAGCDELTGEPLVTAPTATATATATPTCCVTAVVGAIRMADDHADDLRAATPLQLEEAAAGRLESDRDRDVFALSVQAGERYELTVSSAGATILRLLAADGSELRAGAPGQGLRFDAPADGTCYLVVEPVAGSLDYALLASRLQP